MEPRGSRNGGWTFVRFLSRTQDTGVHLVPVVWFEAMEPSGYRRATVPEIAAWFEDHCLALPPRHILESWAAGEAPVARTVESGSAGDGMQWGMAPAGGAPTDGAPRFAVSPPPVPPAG
jgi:hypothetical protein